MATAPNKKPLAALVGTAAAGLLAVCIPAFEGTIYHGYRDPIGVVTACTGNVTDAKLGKTYTKQECAQLLDKDLMVHAEGADKCVPFVSLTPGQRVAAVSFTFNEGVAQFCGSTFARKLKSHDPTACAELDRWTKAGGIVLPGLVTRRRVERQMCERTDL